MDVLVLDAHAHCGLTVPFTTLSREWQAGGIDGGVVFAPVEEIYDRHDRDFKDSESYRKSRRRVHKYLMELAEGKNIYPYYFMWNDFSPIPEGFCGIKWHRHADEPVYQYASPQCKETIENICQHRLPVLIEEEFANTLDFVRQIAERTTVIIPHMGGLNGGYARLKRIGAFESANVWVDTALASLSEISDFAATYGTERILFGSDYPFGLPSVEKQKLSELFSGNQLRAVLGGNLRRLMASLKRSE